MKTACVVVLLILLPLAAMAQTQTPAAPGGNRIPEISGGGGKCTVDFRVTDPQGHAVYDAKINTTIRYGLASQRKLELEAATNADGRARFVKLSEALKPVTFSIRYGGARASELWNPSLDCLASYDITLRTDVVPKGRTAKAAPSTAAKPRDLTAADVAPAAPAAPAPAAPKAAAPATATAPVAAGKPAAAATSAAAPAGASKPAAAAPAVKAAPAPGGKVTEVNADMGGNCSVEFKVTDMKGAGIYDAKITTSFHYGFMSQRRLDLEAGTNADGRARFIKLSPDLKAVTFTVTNGVDRARRVWAPNMDCIAEYTIPLRTSK